MLPSRQRLNELLYPELRAVPESERSRSLDDAKKTPFDVIEIVGLAMGLGAVTALTSYAVDGLGLGERVARSVSNFIVAIPLLALTMGPFLWRRTRRGLRKRIEK